MPPWNGVSGRDEGNDEEENSRTVIGGVAAR